MKVIALMFGMFLSVTALAITPPELPSLPDLQIGEWKMAMWDLEVFSRNGNTKWLEDITFTVDINKKQASIGSDVLSGRMREMRTNIEVYYDPRNSEAQIQTGFPVVSLETGVGFVVINGTVFTSDDGTSMWGHIDAIVYDMLGKKKALYRGNISFYRSFDGGKG